MEQWALLRGASDIHYLNWTSNLLQLFEGLQDRLEPVFDPRSTNPLGAHNGPERSGRFVNIFIDQNVVVQTIISDFPRGVRQPALDDLVGIFSPIAQAVLQDL